MTKRLAIIFSTVAFVAVSAIVTVVYVSSANLSVKILNKPEGPVLLSDKTLTLYYKTSPQNAGVIWKSSNKNIAEIDENGVVSFEGEGSTVITLSIINSEKSDKFVLEIINPIENGNGEGGDEEKEKESGDDDDSDYLFNQGFLSGRFSGGENKSRVPKDGEFLLLEKRKQPLKTFESYAETFDGDYFNTRIFPDKITDKANAYLSAERKFLNSGGNVFVFEAEDVNQYIIFGGMEFSGCAKLKIELDYMRVEGLNGFNLCFRSKAGGKSADKIINLPAALHDDGHAGQEITLDNYSDYYIMLIAEKPGVIAIDNLFIEKLPVKPVISNIKITGGLEIGGELVLSYDFYGGDEGKEGNTQIKWLGAINESGFNAVLYEASGNEKTITIEASMSGKYLGVHIIPASVILGKTIEGGGVYYYLEIPVPADDVKPPDEPGPVKLESGDSVTLDFENPYGIIYYKGIKFSGIESAAEVYATDGSLYVKINNNKNSIYDGLTIENIEFEPGSYKISFDYLILEKSGDLKICLSYKSNADDGFWRDIEEGGGCFEWEFEIADENDYYICIFGDPAVFVLDNFTIYRY